MLRKHGYKQPINAYFSPVCGKSKVITSMLVNQSKVSAFLSFEAKRAEEVEKTSQAREERIQAIRSTNESDKPTVEETKYDLQDDMDAVCDVEMVTSAQKKRKKTWTKRPPEWLDVVGSYHINGFKSTLKRFSTILLNRDDNESTITICMFQLHAQTKFKNATSY